MKRQAIDSSMIVSAGYENGIIEIEFKNGAVYQYDGADQHIFEEFLDADSKGSFLHHNLKSYPTTKVKGAD